MNTHQPHTHELNPLEITERLTRVEEAIKQNTQALQKLEHTLLGNGKPGAIHALKKRVRVLEMGIALMIGGFGGDKLLPYLKELFQ